MLVKIIIQFGKVSQGVFTHAMWQDPKITWEGSVPDQAAMVSRVAKMIDKLPGSSFDVLLSEVRLSRMGGEKASANVVVVPIGSKFQGYEGAVRAANKYLQDYLNGDGGNVAAAA